MPDDAHGSDRGTVRQVAWRELLPWLVILRSFRLAIDPRQLLLAAVGVLLTAGGWWVLALVFSGADQPNTKQLIDSYRVYRRSTPASVTSVPATYSAPVTVAPGESTSSVTYPVPMTAPVPSTVTWDDVAVRPAWPRINPIIGTWSVLSRPFLCLFDRQLDVIGFAFVLLCALWAAAVWALFGGAITRLAAMRLTRDERVPLGHGITHARQRWGGYFWAPLFPLIGAILPALGLAAVGWLFRFDVGLILIGVLLPLMLIGGLLIAILLLGLMFGWPLMWATVSVEGTDTFDALSRTYAYVYQRPLAYLFYVLVATLFSFLGGLLAWSFARGVVFLTLWGTSWSAGAARTELVLNEVGRWVSITRTTSFQPSIVASSSNSSYFPGPVSATWTPLPATSVPPTSTLPSIEAGASDTESPAQPSSNQPAPIVVTEGSIHPAPSASVPVPAQLSSTGRFGARLIAIWIGGVELLVVAFNFSFFWCAATAVYLLMRKQVDATEMDEVYVEEEEERYGLPPLETDSAGVPQAADVEADAPPETNGGSQ